MGSIRTILGDIPAVSFGITYVHEHTISQPPRSFRQWEADLVLDSIPNIVQEISAFRALGGSCLVDATAVDYGRDVNAMVQVAELSGVHIIATAGFNKGDYFTPAIAAASREELEAYIWREATEGMDGTKYRPGMLKFGTGYNRMSEAEERTARAVCRVQSKTGLPLYTHTEIGTLGLEQIGLLREENVNPERVCIGHIDRNPDAWYAKELLKCGVYIGIDQIGKIKYHPEQIRINLIIHLVRHGYGKKILLSGDMARRSYLRSYGGGPGFRYILDQFIPRLKAQMAEASFTPQTAEAVCNDLLIENPKRFFSL
ncbi:MAG: phosphotriesterase family protein [bacterium]|jgi:predicted metal-dependent phosphotriesterase family hydrolase